MNFPIYNPKTLLRAWKFVAQKEDGAFKRTRPILSIAVQLVKGFMQTFKGIKQLSKKK